MTITDNTNENDIENEDTTKVVRLRSDYRTMDATVSFEQLMDNVVTVANWRSPADLKERVKERAADLRAQGQQTEMWVRPLGDIRTFLKGQVFDLAAFLAAGRKLGIIRGHCRDGGFRLIYTENPAEAKRLFPNGIRVRVFTDVTAREAALLSMDNASSVNMRKEADWIAASGKLFDQGCSRADVVVALEEMTAQFEPITDKSKNGKEIYRLRGEIEAKSKQIAGFVAEGASQSVVDAFTKDLRALEDAHRKVLVDYRRGILDRFINHYNGGVILDWLIHKDKVRGFGTVHPDCPADLVANLSLLSYTKEVYTKLAAAARKDLTRGDKAPGMIGPEQRGVSLLAGTTYNEVFKKLVGEGLTAKTEKDSKEPTVRLKALSGAEVIELAGRRVSNGLVDVLNVVSGTSRDVTPEQRTEIFAKVDGDLSIAEIVKTHNPALWLQCQQFVANFKAAKDAEAVKSGIVPTATESTAKEADKPAEAKKVHGSKKGK